MKRAAASLFALCALVLLARSASAKPRRAGKPDRATLARLNELNKKGEAHLANHEYAEALATFEEGYRLLPLPGFLFNMGQAARLAGNARLALGYYTRYLEENPSGSGSEEARVHKSELEARVAEEDARLAAEAAERERLAVEAARREAKRREDEAAAAEADRKRREAEASKPDEPIPSPLPAVAPTSRHPGRRGRGLRIAGVITGGVGVALVGVGVYFGLRAKEISDELSERGALWDERYAEGEEAEQRMFVFVGVGGAAVVSGAIMSYLGWRAGRAGPAVEVAPGGAALTLRGRFH